ncbi:ABC transporter permease [Natrialbaceae archaeon A-CW2]|uniref:ABC transporter permease n=1 Tax=Natronosalvus amylolyticus TaxID=2961994 RepID=UPI0020C94E40|nr:ABC transporter permease [Natronosalvus amylolyticus]
MNWHLKRAGQALFTLWAVVTLSFVMIRMLPWSAEDIVVAELIQQNPNLAQNRDMLRRQVQDMLMIDPDASITEAYVQYMMSIMQGDLGTTYGVRSGEEVSAIIAGALPWTIWVMSLATFGMFALALALGAIMAYREQSAFDYSNSALAIVAASIPYYVAAVVFIKYIGFSDFLILEMIPARNRLPDGVAVGLTFEFVSGAFRHALLPALSFIVTGYGLTALAMRGNSIQTLGEDYVRVARLRGLPDRRIALRYVGRNAVLPLYTWLIISIGTMFGGAVILEQLFNYHGVGYWMLEAIEANDMPLMMGTFIVLTAAMVVAIWFGDLTYGKLDPRIKTGDEGEAY